MPCDLAQMLSSHHERSFAWALACCGWNRAEAEDALQNAYLKVLEGRARFAGRSAFPTWLFGVIRKTAGEQRRRARRQEWIRRRRRDEFLPAPGPEMSVESESLRRALAALPRRQREVLHLVFYSDLSIREAAGVMGTSLGTARRHYERGKGRLRERLGLGGGP